jgi:hypothetical protein
MEAKVISSTARGQRRCTSSGSAMTAPSVQDSASSGAAHRHVQFDDRDHDGDRDQVAHADIQRPRLLVHVITVRGRLSPRKAAIPARKFLQK